MNFVETPKFLESYVKGSLVIWVPGMPALDNFLKPFRIFLRDIAVPNRKVKRALWFKVVSLTIHADAFYRGLPFSPNTKLLLKDYSNDLFKGLRFKDFEGRHFNSPCLHIQ